MTKSHRNRKKHQAPAATPTEKSFSKIILAVGGVALVVAIIFLTARKQEVSSFPPSPQQPLSTPPAYQPTERWLQRAYAVDKLFHQVYTPGWEGAYGAIGDAYLFAVTNDSALLRFHTVQKSLLHLDNGYWVDDRAWACIAELKWWDVSGRWNMALVSDASARYTQARNEGRLSHHEGYWTWYNWPPGASVNEKIFTNSNMNQMITVACLLYDATHDKRFLDDALLVWNGDAQFPGIEKTLYRGDGKWEGRKGRAAFGDELPWKGTGYCSIGAALYRVTGDAKYKKIVVATAKRIMDPRNGWVDPEDFFQIHMDGNGAFVNFLIDAYLIAPAELADIPEKIEKTLEHVWTNHHGRATVTLHRESDHGIRNGWNPNGGEDGYGVGEVGTVHAQGEAARAFGAFAYAKYAAKNTELDSTSLRMRR
ncbi:MAG: hypothetical protein AAB209_12570, partial [Bacteroidota bacterium]